MMKFKKRYDDNYIFHDPQVPNLKGRLAIQLVERFGMVTCDTEKEDSKGRARMELMPPEGVVARAMVISSLLVDAMERNGWIQNVPAPWEVEDENDD